MFKREKRFLLLMREYVLGGAETQFRYLLEYAERKKWKFDVLIEHDLNKDDELLGKDISRMNYVRFYELAGGRECGKLYRAIMIHVLRRSIRTKYAACLIYHPDDLAFVSFMRIMGIKVVYSERVDASAVAGSPNYQKDLKFCRFIMANSKYAQEVLQRVTGRKAGLIRNGKPIVPQFPLKEERQIHRILVPARIAPPKNQMLPLHFLKKCGDFDGKVVFAGLVEDRAYYGKLKQFIRKNGLEGKIEFLGFMKEMSEEYRKADLVLLPSFAEGTPNVVLEAYAYGRPVIVSDIEVERDIVPNPALRFGVKNPEGIADCIKYVEELSDDSYRQLIEENRKVVMRDYRIKKMANSFYMILSKC